jgi:general secretion pathway protein F
MAVFEYKALEKSGKSVRGVVDADTAAAARQKLREQQLYPTKLRSADSGPSVVGRGAALRTTVGTRDIALMTRQLAVLLAAGMPLADALHAVIDQTPRARLRKTIYEVRGRLVEGVSLADALQAHPRIFTSLYVNMVRAGEKSGSLEAVLDRLAAILEHQARLRARVLSTLAYPAFMVIFAVGIISFLTFVVVPRITQLFERREQELPPLTKLLIATTDFVGSYWWAILGVLIAIYASWRAWIARDTGHATWDRMKLRFPIYGKLHVKLVCGRFARVLGTMLQSGLTMMRALQVVSTVIGNRHIETLLESVKAEVRRGRGLAGPLRATGVFPPLLVYMAELGERSGEMEASLIRVADTLDEDVQVTMDALVSLLEPVIIVVMGVFVGLLVLSILLPILNLSTQIG